ncbi:hypothetical protein [Salmonella enterica]|uniref:hypothetical protein n=1 Tax=Salmonella enterica TaxID=28901 RepID=UPI0013B43B37
MTASHNPMRSQRAELVREAPPDKQRPSARRSSVWRNGRLPASERGRAQQP